MSLLGNIVHLQGGVRYPVESGRSTVALNDRFGSIRAVVFGLSWVEWGRGDDDFAY